MIVSMLAGSRVMRYASVLIAATTGYATSALGINAVFSSIGEAIRQYQRLPHGHYTTEPTAPYLGAHPGRDPKGRGIWKARPGAADGGHFSVATSFLQGPHHTLAVDSAPGAAFPWEGSAGTSSGSSLNTGNGDLVTKLHLVDWKSRGLGIDFTLYHNSETNYSDELGAGWTWTYDIYINNLTTTPTVHWGDGTSIPYSSSGGGGGAGAEMEAFAEHVPMEMVTGTTYTPPAGIYDQLIQNTDTTWTLTKKNGTK